MTNMNEYPVSIDSLIRCLSLINIDRAHTIQSKRHMAYQFTSTMQCAHKKTLNVFYNSN